jgi:MarR family transcriptional regulator, temperature-dependent positive regulator of motility
MKAATRLQRESPSTVWRPEPDVRELILAAILHRNPIPIAFRVNYLANFYVGPLVTEMEGTHRMTRSEWIVLFCLHQRRGLNAQQISSVTGRPKTSIAAAIKQLLKKKLILRKTDIADRRCQVVHVTEAGGRLYEQILERFMAREAEMIKCLNNKEREAFLALLNKLISNSPAWAQAY